MRIVIENTGEVLDNSTLVRAILRYDLVPIPCNLEITVRLNEKTQDLKVNDKILLLDNEIPFVIVAEQSQTSDLVQGQNMLGVKSYIAILDGLQKLMQPTSKAILLEHTSFHQAYKACGLKGIGFAKDVPLLEFDCFFGQIPSYEVAKRCCEEASVILFDGKTINAVRLDDLKKQQPVYKMSKFAVEWENHQVLEHSKIHNYVSIDKDGSTLVENMNQNQKANYYPNMDSRRLRNLRTVLVRKGYFQRALNLMLKAGDVVQVGDEYYIILTVAHVYATGSLDGQHGAYTKAWLSQVN